MPSCKEHEDCDLVCSECGSYYCQSDSHEQFYWLHVNRYNRMYNPALRTPRSDDMPDDPERYYNERAERMP